MMATDMKVHLTVHLAYLNVILSALNHILLHLLIFLIFFVAGHLFPLLDWLVLLLVSRPFFIDSGFTLTILSHVVRPYLDFPFQNNLSHALSKETFVCEQAE